MDKSRAIQIIGLGVAAVLVIVCIAACVAPLGSKEKSRVSAQTTDMSSAKPVDWYKYKYRASDPTCKEPYVRAMQPFILSCDNDGERTSLTADMVTISEENKYILTIDRKKIGAIAFKLPKNRAENMERIGLEEETFVQLLFSTSEIRAEKVGIYCKSEEIEETAADSSILSAVVSRLRGCADITILNIREVKSSERYSGMASSIQEEIIHPSMPNVKADICAWIPVSTIEALLRDVFTSSNRLRISELYILYNGGAQKKREIAALASEYNWTSTFTEDYIRSCRLVPNKQKEEGKAQGPIQ